MSKEAVSNVSYPVAPGTTVLLSIDCQFGSGVVEDTDAFVARVRALQPAAG
jgi:hypothetical protein